MDTLELADTIADPIGTVGMSFYFSPHHAGSYFALHGYGDEDRAEETEELVATRLAAEVETSNRMGALLEVLDGAQRAALAQGAIALHEAVASPVAAA
jgi:hypothetical protein